MNRTWYRRCIEWGIKRVAVGRHKRLGVQTLFKPAFSDPFISFSGNPAAAKIGLHLFGKVMWRHDHDAWSTV